MLICMRRRKVMHITVEDVKGFMASRGYIWTGWIMNEDGTTRKAVDNDFNQWYTTAMLELITTDRHFWQECR